MRRKRYDQRERCKKRKGEQSLKRDKLGGGFRATQKEGRGKMLERKKRNVQKRGRKKKRRNRC